MPEKCGLEGLEHFLLVAGFGGAVLVDEGVELGKMAIDFVGVGGGLRLEVVGDYLVGNFVEGVQELLGGLADARL